MPNLTTQTIHTYPIADTPAGPLYLEYNAEARWVAIKAPAQIPASVIPALIVALGIVDRIILDGSTIRKRGEVSE